MGEPMDYIFQMTKHSGSINPWYQPSHFNNFLADLDRS